MPENDAQKTKSFHFRKIFELPGRHSHSMELEEELEIEERPCKSGSSSTHDVSRAGVTLVPIKPIENAPVPAPKPKIPSQPTDLEMMKERFAKLLLGEDMSGGGNGVSSALALSNAITNLAASVFGEQRKLEPMPADRKARWKKEVDWLLSVTDYIVELVPSQQTNKDGSIMEIMVTKQRKDLLMNIPALKKLDAMLIDCLDNFKEEMEFWYVSKDADESEQGVQRNNKWWLPTVKVPKNGLSDNCRKWMQTQKDAVNQVLKASMAINAQVLSEMEIPENYLESLPKNGRSSLGDSMYKSITIDCFDPTEFLSHLDLSTEHKVLDLKNKIEASIMIWRRKMHHKDSKSSWSSAVSTEKRELFEERAETILLLLKLQFPGLPQSSLDISKIQFNVDVGHAILESYTRVLESLANTVMSRIDDVLYADSLAHDPSLETCSRTGDRLSGPTEDSETLSDIMGWYSEMAEPKEETTTTTTTKSGSSHRRHYYMEKLESLSALKGPTRRYF
ncbi:rho guanine nucleotide exchange factor 8-like [Impatiens glandulifera]|uniref:rho guanine nucleotide exchange factor 8-like n=1 Tax=Impatiens glandulifera TaxID=253017 RepID=UPI001FB12853|nr:rho guanine nucleotide exchange factor 8-like [Impatiens glandulifera]